MFTKESEWRRVLIAHARTLGWKVGSSSAAHSDPGLPDLVLVNPRGDVVFAELKTDNGSVSRAQRDVLLAAHKAGVDVYVWRPRDMAVALARLGGADVNPDEGLYRSNPQELQAEALDTVLAAVCEHFEIEPEEITASGRQPAIVLARWAYMAAARELTGASLPAIGRVIHRDHTTVLHGLRAAQSSPEASTSCSQATEAARRALA